MKAIILCAGYATRLYPLTRNRPKALLEVNGHPILEYIAARLAGLSCDFDLEKIFVVTNHKYYNHFCRWQKRYASPVPIEVINDGTRTNDARLGSVGDVRYVIAKKRLQEDVLVIAGDNLFDDSLIEFLKLAGRKKSVVLAVTDIGTKRLASQYGILKVDQSGKVKQFVEKPQDPPSTLASSGIYFFPKPALQWLERFVREEDRTDAMGFFIQWLVKNYKVYTHPMKGRWFDIGDKVSLKKADQLYRKRKKLPC
jgi:glucose-1-phosphate thymidylyltransferase